MEIEKYIRDVPDFPKPGIIFKDITPLLANNDAFQLSLNKMYQGLKDKGVSKVLGIESRGFIFASALAAKYNMGLILVRKPGKLPHESIKEEYALEYGTDALEIHKDAINPGEKVWMVDDLLATGGTARAASNLVKKLNGIVVQASFVIELSFLNGRDKLNGVEVDTIISY